MTETGGRFKILKSEELDSCATFELNDEDHTLGNALRHIILKNPNVRFCGYALPHPNERKINIQIQVYSGTALDALVGGLRDLIELNQIVKEKILAEKERFGPVELVDSDGEDDTEEQAGEYEEEEEVQEESEPARDSSDPPAGQSSATVPMREESW